MLLRGLCGAKDPSQVSHMLGKVPNILIFCLVLIWGHTLHCLELTPGGLRGPFRMSGIEPGLAECKANALPTVLSLRPSIIFTLSLFSLLPPLHLLLCPSVFLRPACAFSVINACSALPLPPPCAVHSSFIFVLSPLCWSFPPRRPLCPGHLAGVWHGAPCPVISPLSVH